MDSFKNNFSLQPKLDGLAFDVIDMEEASWLESPFKESEVLEVVKSVNGEKVFGPDSFSMAFFPDFWEVIKPDIIGVFQDFHTCSKFEKV